MELIIATKHENNVLCVDINSCILHIQVNTKFEQFTAQYTKQKFLFYRNYEICISRLLRSVFMCILWYRFCKLFYGIFAYKTLNLAFSLHYFRYEEICYVCFFIQTRTILAPCLLYYSRRFQGPYLYVTLNTILCCPNPYGHFSRNCFAIIVWGRSQRHSACVSGDLGSQYPRNNNTASLLQSTKPTDSSLLL